MKKRRILVAFMLFLGLTVALVGLSSKQVLVAAPANVGVLEQSTVDNFAWVKGNETDITNRFIAAYESTNWTLDAEDPVTVVQFDKARHALVQKYGNEGAIIFNDFTSEKPIIVTDIDALDELEVILSTGDNATNGILLDVVESGGETYYVTDRYNEDGIFKIVEGVPEYMTLRVGQGTGTYRDVMWSDYVNAYKFATNFMEPLGLPLGEVALYQHTTNDLNDDGTYAMTDGEHKTSLKAYTKQQFENGWIIQARFRILNDPETNALGDQHNVFYPAAPILNDMYDAVVAITDNADLSVTGAPISIEYTLANGDRLQNFEFGYVTLSEDVATFTLDKIVDNQGTEMNRRIGHGYKKWQPLLDAGGELAWEMLRVGENFRNTFGQIIRDDRISDHNAAPSLRGTAPRGGLWFGFPGGKEHEPLGFGSLMLYQAFWYTGAFELAPGFNNAPLLFDNLDINGAPGLGRPISEFVRFEAGDSQYQFFSNGFAYIHNSRENRAAGGLNYVLASEFDDWLGTYENVEDKIMSLEFDVTFTDQDDNVIEVVTATYNTTAEAVAPEAPVAPEGYEFAGWIPDVTSKAIIEDTTFKADFALMSATPETGKIGYLNFDILEHSATFWYDNADNVISVDEQALFHAWRHGRENAADAIAMGGLPLYADATNLVTTKFHYVLNEGVVTKNDTIGKVPAEITNLKSFRANVAVNAAVQDVISDSFGDAYIYTWDHLGLNLGLPVGPATSEVRTKQTDIFASSNEETFTVLIQEFENGFIFQEEYTHAAFPLFGEMYDHWLTLGGLNGEGSLGTPMGVPVEYEGVKYQNFTNGYMAYDGTDFTVELGIVKVDNKGRELDGRAGLTEGRNNVKKGHPDFETEMLRAFLTYQEAFTEAIDRGYVLDEVANFAGFIHEWGGNGTSNAFRNSGSTSNVWGQTQHLNIVLKSPHDKALILVDKFLTKYAEDGMRGALGFPLDNSFELAIKVDATGKVVADGAITLTVNFQNFENGVIRTYIYNDEVFTEEIFDGNVNAEGEFIVDGEVAEMKPFTLAEIEVDTADLEAKLAELKASREGILKLEGDIATLPKENRYAPAALLDEIDAEILRVEQLLEAGTMSQSDVFTETENLDDLLLDLENSTVNGEYEKPIDEDPVDEDPVDEEPESKGLSTGAIVAIVIGGLVVIGGAGFVVWKFVIVKS